MSNLVGNIKERFSHNETQIMNDVTIVICIFRNPILGFPVLKSSPSLETCFAMYNKQRCRSVVLPCRLNCPFVFCSIYKGVQYIMATHS